METLCLISIPLIQGNTQHNLTFAGVIKNSDKDNVKVLVTNGYMKGHTNDVPKDYIVDSFVINLISFLFVELRIIYYLCFNKTIKIYKNIKL